MEPVRIDDPLDERVAAYVDIRERDLVGRQGRFVAEGKVVLDVLTATRRFGVESVLILENRLAGMQQVLARLPADVPVYVVSAAVMDHIAGFHMHRGILAIGLRGELVSPEQLLGAVGRNALVAVLVGISNHDNVGSIFRNAAAFGANAVLLDKASCDPLYRKAIRVSVGAALKVPFAVADDATIIADLLEKEGVTQFALSPRGETDIRDIPAPRACCPLPRHRRRGIARTPHVPPSHSAHHHGAGVRQPERRRSLGDRVARLHQKCGISDTVTAFGPPFGVGAQLSASAFCSDVIRAARLARSEFSLPFSASSRVMGESGPSLCAVI